MEGRRKHRRRSGRCSEVKVWLKEGTTKREICKKAKRNKKGVEVHKNNKKIKIKVNNNINKQFEMGRKSKEWKLKERGLEEMVKGKNNIIKEWKKNENEQRNRELKEKKKNKRINTKRSVRINKKGNKEIWKEKVNENREREDKIETKKMMEKKKRNWGKIS